MSEKLAEFRQLLQQLSWWEEKINEALAHGRCAHSFDDVVRLILQGNAWFVPRDNAFVIMEKVDYPQFSVFHCFLAGGDLSEIIEIQEEMAQLGAKMGCAYLSLAGRKGWLKALAAYGWEHVCTTMYRPLKEIADEQRGPTDFPSYTATGNHRAS